MTPTVSVVIPTRNRRDMLARALASVRRQTVANAEIVVIDDGSADETVSRIAREWPEVRLLHNRRPVGAAAARNRGVVASRGSLVAFLDDDDWWDPQCLAAHVEAFSREPAADLSVVGHRERDPCGRIRAPDLRPLSPFASPLVRMLAECPIHSLSTVAVRRSAFERFGCFDESLRIVHDLDWYVRILRGGGRFVGVSRPLVARSLPGGLVTDHLTWHAEERRILDRTLESVEGLCEQGPMIRASRALFFARVALERGDLGFAALRLRDALAASVRWTMRITAIRLARRLARIRATVPEGMFPEGRLP